MVVLCWNSSGVRGERLSGEGVRGPRSCRDEAVLHPDYREVSERVKVVEQIGNSCGILCSYGLGPIRFEECLERVGGRQVAHGTHGTRNSIIIIHLGIPSFG